MLSNATKEWDRETFSWDYLKETLGDTVLEESPRDNDALTDLTGWTVRRYPEFFILSCSSNINTNMN